MIRQKNAIKRKTALKNGQCPIKSTATLKSYTKLESHTGLKTKTQLKSVQKPLAKTVLKSKSTSLKHTQLKNKTSPTPRFSLPGKVSKSIKSKQLTAKKTSGDYFSIFGKPGICIFTGDKKNIVPHHIFEGPYKAASEKYGFILFMRRDYHTGYSYSIHENPELLKRYKIICENYYVDTLKHSKEEFISEFGKWY